MSGMLSGNVAKKKKKSKGLSDESIKPPSMYDNSQIIFVVLKHE